jgi:hypothetical protein
MKELTICTRRRRELLLINLGFRNKIGAMKELTICTRRRRELLLIKC